MKKYLSLLLLLAAGSCAGDHNFDFSRTACAVNYGLNGFSVIVDHDRIIVRNNRIITNSGVALITADRTFRTSGRYFHESDAADIVNNLRNSPKVYMNWQEPSGTGGTNTFRATIDTSDFAEGYDNCRTNQAELDH